MNRTDFFIWFTVILTALGIGLLETPPEAPTGRIAQTKSAAPR